MSGMRGSRDDRARRLTAISRALTYARSIEEVLELTLDCATDIFDTPRAVLMLADDDGLLRVRASRGIDEESVERFREPLDEKLLSRLTGLFGDNARDVFLGVPLVSEGGVTGLLGVLRDQDPSNDDEEEWLLSALADQAAVALESTRHRDVRASLESRLGLLERERKDKEHAIEILSHDMRSPLNAIQGYASLISAGILGDVTDRQHDALLKIRRISEHLTSILTNVLEMAKLSGGIELEPGTVALSAAVVDAIDIVRPSAEAANIELQSVADEELEVETDPNRVRQVVVQLLENAVKYGPDRSIVRVEQRLVGADADAHAEIAIVDFGPGIPEEMQEEIFQPYVRHDGTAARGHVGAGLGLAIAKNVVEHLGGTLTVESVPGEGSTFRIRLPLRRTEA